MKDWELIILTLEWCGHCKQLKEKLNNLNIPYTDIDSLKTPELGDKLEQYYGCDKYPMIILTQPYNIIWLSETFMLPSESIRVFDSIYDVVEDIFKIFNQ
jgi:glutaredoxin